MKQLLARRLRALVSRLDPPRPTVIDFTGDSLLTVSGPGDIVVRGGRVTAR